MSTYRDLLKQLQQLNEQQLDQEVRLMPEGYCNLAPMESGIYEELNINLEVKVSSKGLVWHEATCPAAACGADVGGIVSVEDLEAEEIDAPNVTITELIAPGEPYIKITDKSL
jgi:hypothetical protein